MTCSLNARSPFLVCKAACFKGAGVAVCAKGPNARAHNSFWSSRHTFHCAASLRASCTGSMRACIHRAGGCSSTGPPLFAMHWPWRSDPGTLTWLQASPSGAVPPGTARPGTARCLLALRSPPNWPQQLHVALNNCPQ